MKILGFNFQITRRTAPEVTKGFDPQTWLRGEDVGGGIPLTNAYQQVVWVYRAINALAEQVANVPFLFSAGERGRENLITSGPLLDFYSHPHPQLNRFQYWELRVIWLMLRGECIRVPIWESSSSSQSSSSHSGITHHASSPRLRSVLLLDPSRFQHIVEDHQLIGWRYNGLGPQAPLASQVFLPEEVWFEKLPNPFDFWRGFPPLYAAGMAAQTDFAAGAFMRGVIENNADNGVLVRSETPLGDEQQEQIIAALRERKRKAGTADRPVFLNGVTEIVQPHLSSSDLQFLDNRKFSRAEICAAFGVPEEIVTTTEHAKYDVMAGARLNFIENRVAPLCSRLEAEEEATVRSIDPQASGWFDLDSLPLLQEARRQRLTAARTGFDMGVPFNELNRVLDLGFKPLAWGDRGYVGSKLQEVGNGGTKAGEETAVPVRVMERQLDAAELEPVDAMSRAETWLGGLKAGRASALQRQLLSKLQRFNFEQRGRVLGKLEEQLDDANGGGQLKPDLLLKVTDENRLLTERLQPVLLQAKGTTAEEFLEGINSFNQVRVEQLREACAQALALGENREQIIKRVKDIYNQTGK
jgi:phage portal protein BeeE